LNQGTPDRASIEPVRKLAPKDVTVHRTDVFVIGGGPAGLAAAIAARAKGFSVTVADGTHPPIDKACGEGLMPDTLAALAELGVPVSRAEGHPLHGVRFNGREHEASANFASGHGIGMRRPLLLEKLIDRARACGVSLRWDTPVVGITDQGAELPGGVFPAKWIIGADGIGSRVRKWAGLEPSARNDCRYAVRRHYRMTPWSEFVEVYWGDDAQAYVTPVIQDEVCVVLMSQDRETKFDSLETQFPKLAERLKWATLANTERGAVTMTRKLPRVYRGRVALIGDASGSVDAITGAGLSLGFRQAIALADALEAHDLSQYQAAHRRLARRPSLMGRLMLVLSGHASLRERTLQAFMSDPRIFSRLLAVHIGARSQAQLAAAGALLGWQLVAAKSLNPAKPEWA
jgi:2-polyprenyl-6-methoxyphenol hydroxylase-like FAD-dependent oxidoreductase